MSQQTLRTARLTVLILFVSFLAYGDTVITLRKDFINTYHARAIVKATITPAFLSRVKSATSGSDDGDVHIAAVPDGTIGLPMVAEIANAKLHRPTVATIKTAAANHDSMAVEGVWRIWCEHGGDNEFLQGAQVDTPTDSNPAHVFEIHPLTKVGATSVTDTFRSIDGYAYKDAQDAFQHFENAPSEISEQACTDGGDCVTIRTRMVGYNYTEFLISLDDDPADLIRDGDDSTWVFSDVYDLQGDKVVGGHPHAAAGGRSGKRKMVFVKGTAPHVLLQGLKKGDVLRVVGVPRINLTLVKWRVEHKSDHPGDLTWSLPYEMVILTAVKSTRELN